MSKELEKVRRELEKKFGVNVIRPASDLNEEASKRVSTGSIALDVATQGGYPVGKFIHIAGAFSSSKSSLSYHGIREFQKFFEKQYEETGVMQYAVLIQGESGSFTSEYAEGIGIDVDKLIVNETSSMEEALEIAVRLQESGVAGVIVHDSFASYIPMKEREKEMEDSVQMGLKPKMFDEYFRKYQAINNRLSREGKPLCTVIGLNQIREKIGVMYGSPEYSPGGRSIGHTSSLTIKLRRGESIQNKKKQMIGHEVKFKIEKSKVSIPFIDGSWDFYTDEGGPVPKGHIDNFKALVIEAMLLGIVERGGAWFNYKDLKVQGADNFVNELRNDLELYAEIESDVRRASERQSVEDLVEEGKLTEEEKEKIEEEEKDEKKKKVTVRKKK